MFCGRSFRSRSEARWAVLFQELKIDWRYEPKRFNLSQIYYVPDFLLPDIVHPALDRQTGVWIEVKPGPNTKNVTSELIRARRLSTNTRQTVSIVYGLPMDCRVLTFLPGGHESNVPDIETTAASFLSALFSPHVDAAQLQWAIGQSSHWRFD